MIVDSSGQIHQQNNYSRAEKLFRQRFPPVALAAGRMKNYFKKIAGRRRRCYTAATKEEPPR
jgi:hypothetical protein